VTGESSIASQIAFGVADRSRLRKTLTSGFGIVRTLFRGVKSLWYQEGERHFRGVFQNFWAIRADDLKPHAGELLRSAAQNRAFSLCFADARPTTPFRGNKLTVTVAEDQNAAVVGGKDRMTCTPCQRHDTMPARHSSELTFSQSLWGR
jgi:hypothetical protein